MGFGTSLCMGCGFVFVENSRVLETLMYFELDSPSIRGLEILGISLFLELDSSFGFMFLLSCRKFFLEGGKMFFGLWVIFGNLFWGFIGDFLTFADLFITTGFLLHLLLALYFLTCLGLYFLLVTYGGLCI